MKTLLIIFLAIGLLFLTILVFFVINQQIRTRKLRRNPKEGDTIHFYNNESRERGTIYIVFQNHVRVRDVFGKWHNVNFDNIYAPII